MASKRDWPKRTWSYPLHHDFTWAFGLDMDDAAATKNSTIVPLVMQDNALVDYETVKTNPDNDDFAVVAKPNTMSGSFVPRAMTTWKAYIYSAEVDLAILKTMDIHTAMLNRLDAFDKKTGNDIETILELTHETTDEQCYPLYNNSKLYEGHMILDLPAEIPGLTTTQQPEGVNFDMEMYFDALHYYTNKEMLRQVTSRMKSFTFGGAVGAAIPFRDRVKFDTNNVVPSLCKFQHPYTFCGKLFHLAQAGSHNQLEVAGSVTAVQHIQVLGRTRFKEYNPDFNFSRA